MLKLEEKNKIIELIKQGKTDYAIENETGNAHKTIKEIREDYYMVLGKQIHEDKLNSKSIINNVGRICDNIEFVIKSGQLAEKDKKEWEKRLESLKTLLRLEVNERIPAEIAKAIEKRDQYWFKVIEQQYVKKEDVTNLINEIENLRNEFNKKDDVIKKNQTDYHQNLSEKQNEIDSLMKHNSDIINKNIYLMSEKFRLNNYINTRFYKDLGFGQEELKKDKQIFNNEKTEFENIKNKAFKVIDDRILDIKEKDSLLTIREKRVERSERMIENFNNQRGIIKEKII